MVEDKIEALAAYAHEAWAGWMRYLFSKMEQEYITTPYGKEIPGLVMPEWAVERWQRQMKTPYADLPETEKESDRDEARKILAVLGEVDNGD